MMIARIAARIFVGWAILAFVKAFFKVTITIVLHQDDFQNLRVHFYELSSSLLLSRFSFVAIVDC